jgi:hypothetical protein
VCSGAMWCIVVWFGGICVCSGAMWCIVVWFGGICVCSGAMWCIVVWFGGICVCSGANPMRQMRAQQVSERRRGAEALAVLPARVHLLVQQLLLCNVTRPQRTLLHYRALYRPLYYRAVKQLREDSEGYY